MFNVLRKLSKIIFFEQSDSFRKKFKWFKHVINSVIHRKRREYEHIRDIYETYLRFIQLKMPVICQNTGVSPLNSCTNSTGVYKK